MTTNGDVIDVIDGVLKDRQTIKQQKRRTIDFTFLVPVSIVSFFSKCFTNCNCVDETSDEKNIKVGCTSSCVSSAEKSVENESNDAAE